MIAGGMVYVGDAVREVVGVVVSVVVAVLLMTNVAVVVRPVHFLSFFFLCDDTIDSVGG